MNLLETIEFILQVHDEAGFDHEGICSLLEYRGITIPWPLVQEIIGTLHHHPLSVEDGPIYGVAWAMRGFRIIMDDFAAGETSEHIAILLKERNYDWGKDFVCQLILAHCFWLESGNGNSW